MSHANTISIAVVGVGLVGKEFVSQLSNVPSPNPYKLIALATSKTTIYSTAGLTITFDESGSGWTPDASNPTQPSSIDTLCADLAGLVQGGEKVVLVDNTASDAIAAWYPRFLQSGVHVITPNKKAYSSSLQLYEDILAASAKSGARYLNESTVGAGLPIISTLKDLVMTGDTVTKIEGVFSGTMSYIFNNFSTGTSDGPSFSSVVAVAREKGYTEPHPGDDLNGADVARKLTILSRTLPALRSALPNGYASVDTKSLVPSELEGMASGDEFMARLPEFDATFDNLRVEAFAEKKVLRYVGVVDVQSGVIKASLEKYPVDHAFATSLGGSDNIIMFHTKRYGARPLIVQGAGAGAAVTAMGVMSDLFKIM